LTYQVNLIKWAEIEGPWSPNLNKMGPSPVIVTSIREVTFNRSIQQAGPVATVMVRPVARKQADPSLRMKT
jgi:hypothetical protein